ncbi:MAG: ABC transporter permease, partial [Chloroflexi bacterium]|nr:ABC transporter permease [Chloroflexota bacterium]
GAPPLQVLGAQLVEGLMMAVPAALLGYAGATALLGPASTASPATGAIAVAVVTVAVLLLAALPMARSPVGSPERENAPGLRGGPRRLVLDTLVVVVALVGVASLHNRGLLGEAGGSEAGGVDPFLAAVPLLMGVAAGVLAQRVYPLPMRFLAWLAASRRGLVPSLALRTASRDPGVARLPLLVLLLATAMGVFSSVLLVTIERGQVSSTWQEIGADYRIDPGVSDFLPRELDVGSLPGVEAVATAHEDELRFLGGSLRYEAVTVQALDVPAYSAVVSGSPTERPFPTAFILGPAVAAGPASSSDDPLPAMLSRGLAARSGLAQGDTFALSLPGGNATFAFLGLTEGVVGLPGDDELVLVPTAAVDRASPRRPLGGPRLFIRAPASSEEALRNAVLDAGSTLRLASRPQIFARLHDAPLPAAVRAGLGLALAVALGYAALTVAAGAALALATRRRELAVLRTLGLGGRNAIGLIVLEYAPVILVALAAGLVLGLAMAWLLAPALELETFTGLTGEIAPQVDWGHVILLGVAPIAVVSIAVLLGAWLAQRADLARAVRSVQV